jgi:uncharacterized surface protein with fasciclin (FAS1) repeats
MTYGRSLLRAAMVAAPLSALGFSAQAADVASTIQNQQQFSTLAKAIEAAGIGKSLQGAGPYTIFAPTDQAFAQLPSGTMDYLMQPGNQDQLKKLLQYHVVKGKELQAGQMIGKQAKVDTVEGGKLSLDGMGRMVLLVPTGLTVTRAGDQVIVRREVAAMSAPAVEVAPGGGGGQQAQTDVTQQSNMPATKHQEEVLKQHPKVEQQQTAAQTEGAMPSTKHQREVLRGQQPGEQGAQQQTSSGNGQQQASGSSGNESYQRQASSTDQNANQQAQTDVTQQSNMPATKHQEEVLKQHPNVEQQQTMAQTQGAMPATKHQREVLRGQQPGEQQNGQQASSQQGGQETGSGQQMAARESGGNQGALRQATVIGGPIKAGNGVIYVIDGVLVPQSILSQIESQAQQGRGQMQNNQQGQNQPNKG